MSNLTDVIYIVEAIAKCSMIIMTGLYFTFSNSVMNALKNMENGADVMVEINKAILNPLFLGCFIFSGLSSAWFAITANGILMLSGMVFFMGTTLLTIVKNVPLNNQLRDAKNRAERQSLWQEYLSKWVFWNHIRAASAIVTGLLLVL